MAKNNRVSTLTDKAGLECGVGSRLCKWTLLAVTLLTTNALATPPEDDVCSGKVWPAALKKSKASSPRFDFDDEGDLAFDAAAPDETYRFGASEGQLVVKIERVTPGNPPGKPKRTPFACGAVDAAAVYALHRSFWECASDEALLEITIFRDATEPKALKDARVDALVSELKQAEIGGLMRSAKLQEVDDAAAALLANAKSAPSTQPAEKAIDAALGELDKLQVLCPANGEAPLEKLNQATCLVRTNVIGTLRRLKNALSSSRDIELARTELRDWLHAANAPLLPQHCVQVGALAGHELTGAGSPFRVVAKAQVPELEPARVRAVSYGYGFQRIERVPAGSAAIIVAGKPVSETVAFEVRKREPIVRTSPADVIARFLQSALPLVKSMVAAGVVPPVAIEGRTFACDKVTALVDVAAPPVSGRETATFLALGLEDTAVQEVLVCADAKCPGDQSDPKVKNRIQLVPSEGNHLAVMVEFAANVSFNLSSSTGKADQAPTRASFGPLAPSFEPVGGLTGPDQVYQLRYRSDFRQGFSTGMLLAYVFGRGMVGLGPSLLLGTGGGALAQFNVRVGLRVATGVYITFGPGVGVVKRAVDYQEGDELTVPRPAPDAAKAPEFRQQDQAALTLGLGVALDLASVVTSGIDLVKSFGGSK